MVLLSDDDYERMMLLVGSTMVIGSTMVKPTSERLVESGMKMMRMKIVATIM